MTSGPTTPSSSAALSQLGSKAVDTYTDDKGRVVPLFMGKIYRLVPSAGLGYVQGPNEKIYPFTFDVIPSYGGESITSMAVPLDVGRPVKFGLLDDKVVLVDQLKAA